MKVEFLKFGKLAEPAIGPLVENYHKRLRVYCDVSIRYLKKECDLAPQIFHVGLDQTGTQLSSEKLADTLRQWQNDPAIKNLCFVVGGPYGLNDTQRRQCQFLWSLGAGTFTSDLAWLLAWEQVYRGFSIIHGSSYHHG